MHAPSFHRYFQTSQSFKMWSQTSWPPKRALSLACSENEVEMDIDEGKTRPKKTNLVDIRKRLLCKRTTEAFTDYHGIESDPNLTLVEKIIKLQEVINDATRRKIHYALLQGQLLEDCFHESKEAYKRTLEQVNMKK